jgi:diguanylate cyclase (GGDEF)-like protein/PAS domain S-box-containing protein
MKRPALFPRTLRARMALAFSALLMAAALTAITLFTMRLAQTELDARRDLGQSLIRLLEPATRQLVTQPATALRDPTLARTLEEIARHPAIGRLRITDGDDRLLYTLQPGTDPASWLTTFIIGDDPASRQLAAEFAYPDGRLGRIDIELSSAPLNAVLQDAVLHGLLLLGILLALVIGLSYALLTRFTAPLRPLAEIAREAARGNWTPDVKLIESGSREIQELNQAFAAGAASVRHYLQSIDETRELLEHSENRLRTLINGMHEILFELDPDGDISFLNPAWEKITGYAINESLGRRFAGFLPAPDTAVLFAPERLPELREHHGEIALRAASGKTLWLHLDADAQRDASSKFTGVIGTLGDITESIELNRQLVRYQEDLYHLSITDPLTGLYNRRHFDTQLEVILSDHLPQEQPVCLLMINVDGFKFINDTYGHPAGDEALRAMAQLLGRLARDRDYLARLSGDEFAMILRGTDLDEATRIARRVHDRVNDTRVSLPVGQVQLQCSIGVASAPAHGRSAQELVSTADMALYQAKRRGPNRVEVLSPDISQSLLTIFSQGFRLRHALEQGNLMPAFQPICDIASGKPIAYEALARMHHDGGLIKAADFIGVAEELGLTRDIDLHIIEQALRLAPLGYGLFINLDPSSFHDRGFARELGELIGPACRAGRLITIEITERESVVLSDGLVADIRYLRGLGCKLALDDFGSGYSTYHFLNLFHPEYLKIEGAFVRRMLDHESDRKIVEHIHELATSFGAQTIAESVENEATRAALQKLGIRNAQGLHLGSPRLSGEH